MTASKDSQDVISYRVTIHPKTLGPIISKLYTFKMVDPSLTLKEGSKVKFDIIKRFAGNDFL